MNTISEIDAAEFDRELRSGDPVTVLDVRSPDQVELWSVSVGAGRLISVPAPSVAADPAAVAAQLGDGPVRAICARGRQSLVAASALAPHLDEIASVRGGMAAWGRLQVVATAARTEQATILQLRREARGCLSYLVVSDGEALAVDPNGDLEAYVRAASAAGARIVEALDTHVHADHVSGVLALAGAAGACVSLSAGALDRGAELPDGAELVREGSRRAIGSARVEVLELPGHTSDLVGLLIDEAVLIAGDALFADGIPRPDLEHGEAGAEAAAAALHHTLTKRVLSLDDDVVLLGGHYGGGPRDSAVSATIGELRRSLPEFSLGRDEFVAAVTAGLPPRPANYERIVAANLAGEAIDPATVEVGANNCAARGAAA